MVLVVDIEAFVIISYWLSFPRGSTLRCLWISQSKPRQSSQAPPTLPEQEVPARLLTLVLSKVTMAFTDQSLLDITDKETRERLSLWDRRTDAMAPLTEKQMDSVLEIRAAAETLSLPSEVGRQASQH